MTRGIFMDEEKKSPGFKVTDRRRIDEHGEERSSEGEQSQASAPRSATQASVVSSSDDVRVREDTEEVNFSAFVMSLATQALMQLGQIPPPPGVDLAVDKAAARQTIDIIGMLSQKTKGNLDAEEQRLMEEILNSLRFQFVQTATK